MEAFYPTDPVLALPHGGSDARTQDANSAVGKPGIRMAYFNLQRRPLSVQSNLHLVKAGADREPLQYVEEMFEHRYQKQFGNIMRPRSGRLMRKRGRRTSGSSYYYTPGPRWPASPNRRGLEKRSPTLIRRVDVRPSGIAADSMQLRCLGPIFAS